MKSLPGFKPEIDAEIVFGGDWLYFDPDKSRARINFKGIAKYEYMHLAHDILSQHSAISNYAAHYETQD